MGRLLGRSEQFPVIRVSRPRSSSEREMSGRRDDQPYKSVVLAQVRFTMSFETGHPCNISASSSLSCESKMEAVGTMTTAKPQLLPSNQHIMIHHSTPKLM